MAKFVVTLGNGDKYPVEAFGYQHHGQVIKFYDKGDDDKPKEIGVLSAKYVVSVINSENLIVDPPADTELDDSDIPS